MTTDPPKPSEVLDKIADVVLAYRPKPKSKPAKKRTRRAAKAQKAIGRQMVNLEEV
jgi:hypothetical protein